MPNLRIRGKSAPRGRSPHPKDLKRAAKAAKHRPRSSTGKGKKDGKEGKEVFVTPPVKSTARSVSSESKPRRKLSFGENSVHSIDAENKPGKKTFKEDNDMKSSKAAEIISGLRKELVGLLNNKT